MNDNVKVMHPKLLANHVSYMRQYKTNGGHFLEYKTPCCGNVIETTAPHPKGIHSGETWDSFCSCPFCGKAYYKAVTNSEVMAKAV